MSLSVEVNQNCEPIAEQARGRITLAHASWDMVVLWLATAGLMIYTRIDSAGALAVIRLLLALPVLFCFPGYALSVALFVRRGQLSWVERLGLSIVFSLTLVVFSGLTLYFVGIPIEQSSLLIAVAIASILLSIAGVARRVSQPIGESLQARCNGVAIGSKRDLLALVAIAVLVVANLSAVVYALLASRSAEYYTEFSILNPESNKSDIPLTLTDSGIYRLTVTVGNQESRSRSYELRVSGDHGYVERISVGVLDPGSTWTREVQVPARLAQPLRHLQLALFVDQQQVTPYRELHVWVNAAMEQRQQ